MELKGRWWDQIRLCPESTGVNKVLERRSDFGALLGFFSTNYVKMYFTLCLWAVQICMINLLKVSLQYTLVVFSRRGPERFKLNWKLENEKEPPTDYFQYKSINVLYKEKRAAFGKLILEISTFYLKILKKKGATTKKRKKERKKKKDCLVEV